MAFLCPSKKTKKVRCKLNLFSSKEDKEYVLGGRLTGSDSVDTLVLAEAAENQWRERYGRTPSLIVLQDFQPCVDGEVRVNKGEKVKLLFVQNDWVHVVTCHGERGYIPRDFCKPCHDDDGDDESYQHDEVSPSTNEEDEVKKVSELPKSLPVYSASQPKTRSLSDDPSKVILTNKESTDGLRDTYDATYHQESTYTASDVVTAGHQLHDNSHYVAMKYTPNYSTHHFCRNADQWHSSKDSLPPNRPDQFSHFHSSSSQIISHSRGEISSSLRQYNATNTWIPQINEDSIPDLLESHARISSKDETQRLRSGVQMDDKQHKHCHMVAANDEKTSFKKGDLGRFVVLFGYEGSGEDDVRVKRGEFVTLLNNDDPQWAWVATSDGQEGFIPCNYLWSA